MSATVTGYAIVGALVRRKEFWTKVGEERKCRYGHTATSRYCGDCGSETKLQNVEEPRHSFAVYANKHGLSPQDFWLGGNGLDSTRVYVYPVASFVPSDETELFAIGIKIAESGFDNRGVRQGGRTVEEVCVTPFPKLLNAASVVQVAMAQLDLAPREVQLFTVIYYS